MEQSTVSRVRSAGNGFVAVFQGEELAPRFQSRGAASAYLKGVIDGKRKPERKKDGTRMLKCECFTCGYIARVSRKWIRERGTPGCPDHGAMVCEE